MQPFASRWNDATWKLQQSQLSWLPSISGPFHKLTKVGWALPQALEFWRTEGAEPYFWFLSLLVICWLLWSWTQWKNVSFSSEYSSVFFPTHCFITAGHFPTLSWRDQHGCIDILPSLSFMKGKSFTSGEKRHCSSPISFVPPSLTLSSTLLQTFHFYRRKRKWMSVCACVFEVGRMKASFSVWAQQQVGQWVCVCICQDPACASLTCWFSMPMASRLLRILVCMSSILLRFRATQPRLFMLEHNVHTDRKWRWRFQIYILQ